MLSRQHKMANTRLIRSSRKTPTKFDLHGYKPEFELDGTPVCLKWSVEDVADWIEYLGFEQYRVRKHICRSHLVVCKVFFSLSLVMCLYQRN